MLIEAFKRKLTFDIGTSLSTGEKNVIIWAGIHHKSSPIKGEHGYPDPKYFDNLWQELQDRGIKPEDVDPKPNDEGQIEVPEKEPVKRSGWFF